MRALQKSCMIILQKSSGSRSGAGLGARGFREALLPLCILTLISCGGPRRFVHPEADISYYQKFALVPFENLTTDRAAGEKASNAFLTELLIARRFAVVEPGNVVRAAKEAGLPSPLKAGELETGELEKLGEKTGADAILRGVVREYEMVRVGQDQYPLVTLDIELLDVATGTTVWMISDTKKGGPNLPFVSVGETFTLGELLQKICEEIVSKIPE